jgi:hypothetical protein
LTRKATLEYFVSGGYQKMLYGLFFSDSSLQKWSHANKPNEIFGSFLPSQKILEVKSGQSFFGVLDIDQTTKPSDGSIFTFLTLKLRNRQMDNDCHSS